MIDQQFDVTAIQSVNFGVRLRPTGQMYFVPSDVATKDALSSILVDTIAAFNVVPTPWESHDISEEYGTRRRLYCDRSDDLMAYMSAIFDAGALGDLTNLDEHIADVDFYFAEFMDNKGGRLVGVKKATRLKGAVRSRNRLIRLVDDSLTLIQEEVLRLDNDYDALITDLNVFIFNLRSFEYLSNLVEQVAASASSKVQIIHDAVTFLDLSRIKEDIAKHPRMARNAASIAKRADLGLFRRDRIEALAAQHGIRFHEENGRLKCRRVDEAKLLEILDARRYHLDLADNGGDPYRASARQKVSSGD